MNLEDIHAIRLKSEYKLMEKLANSDVVSFSVEKGDPPYVEEYAITFNLTTFTNPDTTTDKVQFKITLPKRFPLEMPIFSPTEPVVFHPNFFVSGTWGGCTYYVGNTLVDYLRLMYQELGYGDHCIDMNNIANPSAKEWYDTFFENREKTHSDMNVFNNRSFPEIEGIDIVK